MENSLLIQSRPHEVRVALIEGDRPVEVFVEHPSKRGRVGNIYCGRVVRVLPGMQAAFVDVGFERTAFLYVTDAMVGPQSESDFEPESASLLSSEAPDIRSLLSVGQDILVQIQKEAVGSKGARVTRQISLPGLYTVLTPLSDRIGVSVRITEEPERQRLRDLAASCVSSPVGIVVRTAAEGVGDEILRREVQSLLRVWDGLEANPPGDKASRQVPRLIYEDLDLALRATRDNFLGRAHAIVVDGPDERRRIQEFVQKLCPEHEGSLKTHAGPKSLFETYGVEKVIQRALEPTVWLKSGGSIVIESTEALTAVDVNSGRFVGTSDLEDTATQINLEAAKEIAYQLRLRDIGGIVVIDFIDMEDGAHRAQVHDALVKALEPDKARTTVLGFSELGLVQMTRQRKRDSLVRQLTRVCGHCRGHGRVKSDATGNPPTAGDSTLVD